MTTWHATPTDLAAYAAGADDPVLAASVETHLMRCADCRATLAASRPATGAAEAERRWDALSAVVDRPKAGPLARVGLTTRPLLAAWGSALLMVLLVPLLPLGLIGVGVPTLLIAFAPLAPTLAVALAYRPGAEPAGELALAAPVSGLRLVTRRALLVGLGALPVGVAVALTLDLPLDLALAWLLPGLALSALVLLSGTTRLDPATVAAVLGAAWALAVGTPSATRRVSEDVVTAAVASAPGQLLALTVALGAIALTVARRERLTYRSHA